MGRGFGLDGLMGLGRGLFGLVFYEGLTRVTLGNALDGCGWRCVVRFLEHIET